MSLWGLFLTLLLKFNAARRTTSLHAVDIYASLLKQPSFHTGTFIDKWNAFRDVVPRKELQETCRPSFEGDPGSENVVILLHGFTGCPSAWEFLVPTLLARNFSVMRLVLPGHGRQWVERPTNAYGRAQNATGDLESITDDIEDDLSRMPTYTGDYISFANALLSMIGAFRFERPRSLIALGAHSLGATVGTYMAYKNPEYFDRVLIMNPFFGPSSSLTALIKFLPGDIRVNWSTLGDHVCNKMRGHGGSGYCQFLVGNVQAIMDLATDLYCERLAQRNCGARYTMAQLYGGMRKYGSLRLQAAAIRSLQVIATHSDPAVDVSRIDSFVESFNEFRVSQSGWGVGVVPEAGYCMLPQELGHNYFDTQDTPQRDFWWLAYLRNGLADYLTRGKSLDIVKHAGGPWCLPQTKAGVMGAALQALPATQHSRSYVLASPDGHDRLASVLFAGTVKEETYQWNGMYPYYADREVELLRIDEMVLLVVRESRDADVERVYQVRDFVATNLVECARLSLRTLDAHSEESLVKRLQASSDEASQEKKETMVYCSKQMLDVIKAEL